jgi:hypothetical protein
VVRAEGLEIARGGEKPAWFEAGAHPSPERVSLAASWAVDRVWLIACVIGLLALTSAPYLVAALAGPPDLYRVGTFWFFRDFSQYLGAMHDAASSATWLLYDRFSAEAHRPILMYIPYVAIGKLAGLIGIDPLEIYYPVEVVSRVALAAALYAFIATFLREKRERMLAYLLAAFTLGLAAWLVPIRLALGGLGLTGLEKALPDSVNVFLEMQSFGVFLSAPHLMLGLAITLMIPRLYLQVTGGGPRWPLPLATLALGVIHPFNVPVVLSVITVDAVIRLVRHHDTRGLAAILVALAAPAPLVLYNALLFKLDPFWSGTYGVQNLMPSPSPLTAWIDFGIVMIAAPFGIWLLRPWGGGEKRLLLLWVALTFAWMYFPVVFQRRLGFGLQPALAVLAAIALVSVQPRLRRLWLGSRPFNYALALLSLGTSILVFVALLASAATNRPSQVYAWSRAEQTAAEWLAARSTPSDVVLSSIESGNSLIGAISGRVVVGHIVATLHADQKEQLSKQFFSATSSDTERAALIEQTGATYVFVGPRERALGSPSFDDVPGLRRVYGSGGVDVYRVSRA